MSCEGSLAVLLVVLRVNFVQARSMFVGWIELRDFVVLLMRHPVGRVEQPRSTVLDRCLQLLSILP